MCQFRILLIVLSIFLRSHKLPKTSSSGDDDHQGRLLFVRCQSCVRESGRYHSQSVIRVQDPISVSSMSTDTVTQHVSEIQHNGEGNNMSYAEGKTPSGKPFDRRSSIVALSNDHDETIWLEGPDPSDSLNPQNWSPWTKRMLFFVLMSSSILTDG